MLHFPGLLSIPSKLLLLGSGSGIELEEKLLVTCLEESDSHKVQIGAHFYILTIWIEDPRTLSVKGHIVNMLGFAGQVVSVGITQLCSAS